MNINEALACVRAHGYRVSKPKPKKQSRVGPTCVVRFVDGTVCRMTTHTDDVRLDWDRGMRLCQAAYESRRKMPAPAALSVHFERDGEMLGAPLQNAA